MPNCHQLALAKWLSEGLAIPEVRAMHGDAGYLLSNMIAKYSLSADRYLVSAAATIELESRGVDWNQEHKRRRFYGKKSPVIYEHAVPVGIVRSRLMSRTPSLDSVIETLELAGPVAVLLREEDRNINELGLRHRMPEGWDWGDDVLARYAAAKVTISNRVLRVCGAICR